jgi:hypothetical protein
MWSLSLGDRVTGIHRLLKSEMTGVVVNVAGCLCLAARTGTFPLQSIAIHEVQPPLFEDAA